MKLVDASNVRDADLLNELKAQGSFRICFQEDGVGGKAGQTRSSAQSWTGCTPTGCVRRALEASPGDLLIFRHIHTVLGVYGLPYTRQPLEVREYERRQGRMSLIVEAGKLRNPTTGDREAQPLPFGPKARLRLMHLCSEAFARRARPSKSPTASQDLYGISGFR